MTEQLPTLYSFRRCPYAIRARMGLAVYGFNYWLREVDLKDKPEKMLEASPKGTVPILILSEHQIIDESLEVLEWLANSYPDHPWSQLKDILSHDITHRISHSFMPALHRYKYHDRFEKAEVQSATETLKVEFDHLNRLLKKTPYLFGSSPTLLDIAIYPMVRQYMRIDGHYWDSNWEATLNWHNALTSMPVFKDIMKAHPVWDGSDKGILVRNH